MNEPVAAARFERFTPAIVWSFWAAMVVGAATYVGLYALPMPFADEWGMVDVATGRNEPTLAWIWAPHNDHRIPLTKILYLALGRATGYDFRLMALTNVALLSVAAAVLLVAARRVSGRSRLFHLVIPALLLHFGHEINLTWSMQICFTMYALLTSILLAIMVASRDRLSVPAALLTTLAALLLSMCGTWGLIYVPPAALWLAWAGWRRIRSEPREQPVYKRWAGAIVVLLGVGLLAVCAAYGLNRPAVNAALYSTGLKQTIVAAANLLTTGVGPVGKSLRPASPILLVAALCGGLYFLAQAWRRGTPERLPAVGLLLYCLGGVTLCLGIAYGRAGQGATLQTRYGLGLVPLLVGVVFLLARYGRITVPRRLVGPALAALLVIVVVNDLKGWRDGRNRHAILSQVIVEAREGASYEELGRRYEKSLQCPSEALACWLARLHAAQISPYRDLPQDANSAVVAAERDVAPVRTGATDELRR